MDVHRDSNVVPYRELLPNMAVFFLSGAILNMW